MVLERRKKEQTQKEEGEQCRSPLEQVLLQRQQKQQEVMVSTTFLSLVLALNDILYISLIGFFLLEKIS